MRGQIAGVEVTGGALVEIEKIGAVEPLEIEELEHRFAHADVGEHRAARVEDESLHAFGQAVVEFLFNDAAVAHGGKIVAGLPAGRIGLEADVVVSLFESLEVGIAVPVIVELDLIEIP